MDTIASFIPELNNKEMFIKKVVALVQDKNKLNQLKRNIPQQVEKYSSETACEVIRGRVGGKV